MSSNIQKASLNFFNNQDSNIVDLTVEISIKNGYVKKFCWSTEWLIIYVNLIYKGSVLFNSHENHVFIRTLDIKLIYSNKFLLLPLMI